MPENRAQDINPLEDSFIVESLRIEQRNKYASEYPDQWVTEVHIRSKVEGFKTMSIVLDEKVSETLVGLLMPIVLRRAEEAQKIRKEVIAALIRVKRISRTAAAIKKHGGLITQAELDNLGSQK